MQQYSRIDQYFSTRGYRPLQPNPPCRRLRICNFVKEPHDARDGGAGFAQIVCVPSDDLPMRDYCFVRNEGVKSKKLF